MGTDTNKSYRIRTGVGSDSPNVINVNLNQSFDTFEILSLKLTQDNTYNLYQSSYGIVVGRVLANGGFGIPNAKVSIFIEVDDDETLANKVLYPFTSVRSADNNSVRYNLLPDEETDSCHQNVGTFPNKRLLLDNNNIIEVFDKYWKYTTVTNEAGDYMLYGIPNGSQQLHVDIDLSDIGVLSQRPRDMIYKGYNINQFESPNKFKQSTNLDSLSQIYSQNIGLYVYPFWGDTSDTSDTVAITRCDVSVEYKFEPTCVFIGSIVTDTGSNAIGKSCAGTKGVGRMENLIAGEGSIEMIRKTPEGNVEECQIKGNRVIDGNGVWCYQIPMNLDYVRTDEFGNIVPTDDPEKGIPTRTRVRFRISLDDSPNDATARKRCRYLVPNNPRLNEVDYPVFSKTLEADYEFGSATRDESYRDLFWNKVYTVKNYVPRLQKNTKETNRKHTCIKAVNHFGDNNPMPYNNLSIKLSFTYRLICVITKVIIYFIAAINAVLSVVGYLPCWLATRCLKIFRWKICPFGFIGNFVPNCIQLSSEFCDDGVNKVTYFPGCFGCVWDETKKDFTADESEKDISEQTTPVNNSKMLMTCIESSLAQENDATNFNFQNDWINGVLYAPLWFRKKTPKKSFLFGLFRRKAKDQWCSADKPYGNLMLYFPCALNRNESASDSYENNNGEIIIPRYDVADGDCGEDCHKSKQEQYIDYGVVVSKTTMLGQTVYYYKAIEYSPSLNNNKGEVVILFATDIVLLGSLNDCDLNGLPQFFKSLETSTYKLPEDILFTDNEANNYFDETTGEYISEYTSYTEMTGCDWGNTNTADECSEPDGGLFYGIGCSSIDMLPKSCINLSRICELGVSLDETKYVENLDNPDDDDYEDNLLIPDGFVSYDELYNLDERSMFATLNGNNLRTKMNEKNGLYEYDLRYLYPESFDGSLYNIMRARQSGCSKTYVNNYKLETFSRDYYKFRMGDNPFFYDSKGRFPRYENSYYFYFGLKAGKTAIEQFNSQFFSTCENVASSTFSVVVDSSSNSWCNDDEDSWDGYISLDLTGISTPYSITIESAMNSISWTLSDISDEMVYFSRTDRGSDDNFTDYVRISTDDNGDTIYFINDTYYLTVTDASGNVSESEISFTSKYLSYSTYSEDFTIANNVLLEEKGSSCGIASDGITSITSISDDYSVSRDIGGLIGVYNIYYNNSLLYKNYSFRVTVQDKNNPSDFSTVVEVNTRGTVNVVSTTCRGSSKYLTYDSGNSLYLVFGVPEGDTDYSVTVMQLCDGNDTGNKLTKTVTISEPTKYRMYINDINYELISSFTSGWSITGNSPDSANVSRSGSVTGWLSLSDYSDDGPYNWNAEEQYTLAYYIGNGYSEEDAETAMIEARKELISDVKNAFWIMCEESNKTLSLTARTDNFPVIYRVIYRPETYDELLLTNTFDGCELANTDESTITDIVIPTLSCKDSETYGSTYTVSGNICYAADNNSSCTGTSILKSPYFVCVADGAGITIPLNSSAVSGDATNGYILDGNVSKYFGVHFLDKIFAIDKMIAISYFNTIPYYLPSDETLNGQTLTKNGLFTAIINNGLSTSDTTIAEFSTQKLGSTQLTIETYTVNTDGTPNEDTIPTKRIVIGTNNGEYGYYSATTAGVTNLTYASVINKNLAFTLTDENCSLENTIYGNMYISLNPLTSYHDSRDSSNNTLSVLLMNGSNSSDGYDYMYIVRYNGSNYIVNKLTSNSITSDIGSYSDYDDYVKIENEGMTDIMDTSVLSQSPETDEELLVTNYVDTYGYGTTGIFTNITPSAYFIVAITGNNCRAISPVYDFTDITVSICLYSELTYRVITVGPLETRELVSELYKFGVKFNLNDMYYMKYYDYTYTIACNAVSGVTSGTKSTEEGDGYVIYYYEVDSATYASLKEIDSTTLATGTEVTITDYVGLKHNCNVSSVIDVNDIVNEIEDETSDD